MEQNIIIYIGIYKALGIIGTIIAAVAVGTWRAASKLAELGTKVGIFENRLTNFEGRLDSAFAGQSPISLLPKGEKILEESGLKRYIDENKEDLLSKCKSKNPMQNPYDIQKAAFEFFDDIELGDELKESAKNTAFQHGVSMDTVRRVGGIYLRDICLTEAGFKAEDLDELVKI